MIHAATRRRRARTRTMPPAAGPGGTLTAIDVATLRPLYRSRALAGAGGVGPLAFAPRGGPLVAATGNGDLALLDPHAGAVAQRISAGRGGESAIAFSADGRVRLFDLGTQQPLGAPLPAVPNHAVDPIFTPDGAYLLAVSDTGRAYRWDVRPATWNRQACAIAGRTLTRAEWADALPGRPYAPACRT